ncbi:MAG: M15 family metallopeptidase [Clostridia bacterium]|nr:M15 family metallopeptidase [Clostridia bacterium]
MKATDQNNEKDIQEQSSWEPDSVEQNSVEQDSWEDAPRSEEVSEESFPPFPEEADPFSEPFTPEADAQPDTLSERELRILRSAIADAGEDRSELPPYDTSDRAHLVRYAKKNRLVTATVIVIAVGLLIGLALGAYAAVSYFINRPSTSDFTIMLGEDDKDPLTVPYKTAVRDGVFYVDMTAIAEYAGMARAGSEKRMTFAASADHYLRFEHNSELAVINGNQIEMKVTDLDGEKSVVAKAYIEGSSCFVPYQVLTRSVGDGLLFRLDRSTNTLTVKRLYDGDEEKPETLTPRQIVLRADAFTIIPPETEPPKYSYSYAMDIEPYLDSITAENLLLANKQNPLGADFRPNVVNLTCETDGDTQQLQADAANALYAMMTEMKLAGVTDIHVTSSYRSYAQQNWLYNSYYYQQEKNSHPDWTDDQIYAQISTYSSRPGESEHQTGLCVDFSAKSIGGALNNSFAGTEAFAWLMENAHKFGYILRYPEDKVGATQYSYESWHFRFVGRFAASEMHSQNLCLEEYLASLAAETE